LNFITLSDTHTHTVGMFPLDKGSARPRDLYLTTVVKTKKKSKAYYRPRRFQEVEAPRLKDS
jgi:hypothetical protein